MSLWLPFSFAAVLSVSPAFVERDCVAEPVVDPVRDWAAEPVGDPVRDALTVALRTFVLVPVVAPDGLTVAVRSPVVFVGTAFAVRTVLLWPLVAAAPPMRLLLIAMPGPVCVMG